MSRPLFPSAARQALGKTPMPRPRLTVLTRELAATPLAIASALLILIPLVAAAIIPITFTNPAPLL